MWDRMLDWLIARLTGMKQLDDILVSFVKTENQLDKFANKTASLVEKKAEQITKLQDQNASHESDLARAAAVKEQIGKLLGRDNG